MSGVTPMLKDLATNRQDGHWVGCLTANISHIHAHMHSFKFNFMCAFLCACAFICTRCIQEPAEIMSFHARNRVSGRVVWALDC